MFADGGTLPITQTSVPVQFEDIFQTFDAKTRKSIQTRTWSASATRFAGRGSALNDTIASLPALLGYLKPVAQYLSDPNTELTRFFNNLEGVHGRRRPGGADQRPAVHGDGDDVRGDRPQPGAIWRRRSPSRRRPSR